MTVSSPTAGVEPADWGIWGNQRVIAGLQETVRSGRIGHAYLFAGAPGFGKRLTGRQVAKALLCTNPGRTDLAAFCDRCHACRRIERDAHPDFVTYSLQTQARNAKAGTRGANLTIDTIREARAATALRPLESDRRIVAIDDAETMQEAAQEALLKTLEEPPAFVSLLLYAANVENLLPTVRSRCNIVDFRPVGATELETQLVLRGASEDRAREIAVLAHGNPAWAIGALANPQLVQDQYDAVERATAWIQDAKFGQLVAAVKLADRFSKQRDAVFAELELLLRVWRDIVLRSAGLAARSEFPSAATLARVAERVILAEALAALQSVRQCLLDLESNVRPRLALEGMVLQWPTAPTSP